MSPYLASRAAYEDWLRQRLGGDLDESQLEDKHAKMRANPFAFLRGSYWRWAELAPEGCSGLMTAPEALSVGDTHIENFGTWRDGGGRLIWGVNDFDEAATMPYPLDLVRLGVSAALAGGGSAASLPAVLEPLLRGYEDALAAPAPTILDDGMAWLRDAVTPTDKQRRKFRKKYEELMEAGVRASPRFQAALAAAMPEPGLAFASAPRVAGLGSLGRPRWLGIAVWHDDILVIEAKAVVTSAWELARGRPDAPVRCAEIAGGRHRAADPWYRVDGGIVVRRLSPDARKVEVDKDPALLTDPRMLEAMGRELAAVHAGAAAPGAALAADLRSRHSAVAQAAAKMLALTLDDFAHA